VNRTQFAIGVGVTSLVLVIALVATGGLLVGRAFAGSPLAFAGGPWAGGVGFGPWSAGHGPGEGFTLPPELDNLRDVPAGERFAHFKGLQVGLSDKSGKPVTVSVTPGTANAVSATSVTLAANDGSTRTFTIDDHTAIKGQSRTAQSAIAQGDQVVVVTLNGSATATAVMKLPAGGFGLFGH
jgi:hypothetical protein